MTLRRDGCDNYKLKSLLSEKGFNEEEIKILIKESDLIFLNELNSNVKKSASNNDYIKKTIALLFLLLILVLIFIGYIKVGIIVLLIIWSGLKYLKVKSNKQSFLKRN